ncbi:MAG: hypothetical protein L0H93_19270 [Nocardioides sp.]|nr:hypothetical protein [Nocardioides sp.]
MSTGERRLRDALDTQSDVMSDSSLDFDAMRRQANGIRRRRRIGAGVAAAAVLAIIAVPTANLISDDGGDAMPADHDKVLTDEDKQVGDPLQDKQAALDNLEAFPRGDDPQIDYVVDGKYHTPDGEALELPTTKGRLAGATFYKGGAFLATDDVDDMSVDKADATLRRYDARGEQLSAEPGNARFAVSDDGTRLAWWTWDQQASVGTLHSGGGSSMGNGTATATTGNAYVTPIGFLSGNEVVHNWVVEGGQPKVLVTAFGSEPREVGGLDSATGVSSEEGLIAGQATKTYDAVVVDAASGKTLWRAPGVLLGSFSPDGKYVLAFSESAEPMPISILDARTGKEVKSFDLSEEGLGYTTTSTVWEDDDSLLLEGYVFAGTDREDHESALLRLDVNGDVERASEIEAGTQWFFAPRP